MEVKLTCNPGPSPARVAANPGQYENCTIMAASIRTPHSGLPPRHPAFHSVVNKGQLGPKCWLSRRRGAYGLIGWHCHRRAW